jgi:hypothetical protein
MSFIGRIPSSEMLRSVALVRTEVSEEHIASIIRVPRIGELRKTLTVTSSPIPSDLTRDTLRNYKKDGIYFSHRRENLKPYTELTGWTL